MTRGTFAAGLIGLSSLVTATAATADVPRPSDVTALQTESEGDRIFKRAAIVSGAASRPKFCRYVITVRYVHKSIAFVETFSAQYRGADGKIVATGIPASLDDDLRRTKGIPIPLPFMSIETNKYHNPITLTAPRLAPADDLGLAQQPSASSGSSVDDGPRIIGGVTLRQPRYRVTLAGSEIVDGRSTYHLLLEPLRDPSVNRLREIWIDSTTYEAVALVVANLGIGGYYDRMAWRVTYATIGGYRTIANAIAKAPMKQLLGASLDGWSLAFSDFTYPETIPSWVFDLTISY